MDDVVAKTRSARLRRSIQAVADWCRRYRHLPVKVQHAALARRVRGHFNYFGVSGNFRSLQLFAYEVQKHWLKWLRRRSNRTRLYGERVLEWAVLHREELRRDWQLARSGQVPDPIEPLD